jgi:hypothetical protein
MYLEQRFNFFNPAAFNLATNTVLGTTQRWAIDRTWPIEEILIFVNFDATALTSASPTTPDMYDNVLQLVQRVNLSVNDGRQPRSVVDCSGVGLLEYVSNAGFTLDQATMQLVAISQNPVGTAAVPTGVYQYCIRIPCAPQQVGEPLRSRLYLPAHTYPQDPVLTLTFNSLAGMGLSVGSIGTIRVDVMLIRRIPTKQSESILQSTAGSNPTGYIDWDLLETPFTMPLGTASEIRLPIPVPGAYLDLLFRQYKGGAALTRTSTLDVVVGDTIANNLGNETRWRLETGSVVQREWRWKHLRTINDFTRPATPSLVGVAGVISPAFIALTSAGAVTSQVTGILPANFPTNMLAATANYRAGTSAMIPFLQDGFTGDNGNELGSLLDCNTPANNGLKMELIGTPASVATNPSVLAVMGRRFFGDLRRWQKFNKG